MSIKLTGSASTSIAGAKELGRFQHARVQINLAGAGDVTYVKEGAPSATSPWATSGAGFTRATPVAGNDQRYVYQFAPTLAAGAQIIYKGVNAIEATAIGFRAAFDGGSGLGALEAATIEPGPFAAVFQCFLRKFDNVNITSARQFMGFMYSNLTALGQSAIVARVGLMGDGVAGFRFGSVHTPDGAAAGQSAFAAINSGFIAPGVLLNPGLRWFHVKAKLVPPTMANPAAVGMYLDGSLVYSSQLAADFPRGSLATNRNYAQIEAAIFADFDAVTQLNGWMATGCEFWYDTDLTL